MTTIETGKATLTWSADRTTIAKRPSGDWGLVLPLFRNEQRVLRMLAVDRPPVRVPAVVSTARRELVMEAIVGEPLGPKFPTAIDDHDVDEVVAMLERLRGYRPRRRWFRRFDAESRVRAAPLTDDERALLQRAVQRHPPTLRFAHGDVTARNVLRAASGELVLIDWEWAGLHPVGYDRALLWFSLADVPAARARVARWDDPWFVLSATFVQLFHLGMWERRGATPFEVHVATRDELLERVRMLG